MPEPTDQPYVFTEDDLILGTNTALTLAQAQIIATTNSKFSGWFSMSTSSRVSTLMGAFNRMKGIHFCVKDFEWVDGDGNTRTRFTLSELPESYFAELPADLLDSLASASMVDIMSSLECDNTEMQRSEGIMQYRVDKTSHMFRPGIPMRYPIHRESMWQLSPWLCAMEVKLGRDS